MLPPGSASFTLALALVSSFFVDGYGVVVVEAGASATALPRAGDTMHVVHMLLVFVSKNRTQIESVNI